MERMQVIGRLRGKAADCAVFIQESVTSTNAVMKQWAADGAADGTVLIAARQSGGRGRLGRTFFSPDGGLYMSLLLRRAAQETDGVLLTVAAATATAQAVEAVTGRPAAIKWVNDIFQSGRKVCGILCEAAFSADGTGRCYAVVGIGVNVAVPTGGFPQELAGAGALFETAPPFAAEQVAAEILNRLLPFTAELSARAFLAGYRERMLLCGKTVDFYERGIRRQGLVQGVDDDGGLIVCENGNKRTLFAGEVTLHRKGD